MPIYKAEDLRTVAVQSATGSGKDTGHARPHPAIPASGQRSGALRPTTSILVTPNEQLSAQHEGELRASNLPARLFSSEAGAGPAGAHRDHRPQQARGEEGREARRRERPSGTTTLCWWTKGTSAPRARSGASAGRNSPEAASRSSTPPPSTQIVGSDEGPARRLRQVPAVRLPLPRLPPGRLRQGLRHL